MVKEAAIKLTEHVREQVGQGLRTVVIIREEGWEIQYLRSDLWEEYTAETFDRVTNTFRLEEPFLSPEIESRPIGERRAIVHYHENAFVLQFSYSENATILVSLSRDTGRDLLEFIEDCRRIIRYQD